MLVHGSTRSLEPPEIFITAAKFRLGAIQFPEEKRCEVCNRAPNDIFGNHAVTCGNSKGRISRHDHITSEIYRTCQSALFNPRREERYLLQANHRQLTTSPNLSKKPSMQNNAAAIEREEA